MNYSKKFRHSQEVQSNSAYLDDHWIYGTGLDMRIESNLITFFTLYGEKLVETKMAMRGPLKNCRNEKNEEFGKHADNTAYGR